MRAIEGALCTGTRGAGGGVRGQAGWGEWRGNEWDLAIRLYHLKLQAGEPGAANRVICLVSVTRLSSGRRTGHGAVCVYSYVSILSCIKYTAYWTGLSSLISLWLDVPLVHGRWGV